MNRSARRRVQRQLQQIMKNAGDNCSICGKALPHNSKTFGGITADGMTALAGECCERKISEVILSGLYVDRNYEGVFNTGSSHSQKPISSPEHLSEALEKLQGRVTETDKLASGIMKRAGVHSKNASVNLSDCSWKSEDAAWFKKNPKRSHRLRPLLQGEVDTFPPDLLKIVPPPNHEFQVLIRQIEVGQRIRMPFCRDVTVPIPDLEEVHHALFDIISSGDNDQRVIGVREVAELAKRYSLTPDDETKAN